MTKIAAEENILRPWIGTSWKMNGTHAETLHYAQEILSSGITDHCDEHLFIIPPFPYIADLVRYFKQTNIMVGAQNMHWADSGAWTGEISAGMLVDCGAGIVEIGHSERRQFFNETDDTVAHKVQTAIRYGLQPLVCVGESQEEYVNGETGQVLTAQVTTALSMVGEAAIGRLLFAYEPIWSIGTGGTPADPTFANNQHILIKQVCNALIGVSLEVVYGGSVDQENCHVLIQQDAIDGVFVGRAALNPIGFIAIVQSIRKQLRKMK